MSIIYSASIDYKLYDCVSVLQRLTSVAKYPFVYCQLNVIDILLASLTQKRWQVRVLFRPLKSLDRPIERYLYSLRYEHRGELDKLGLEKGSFDGKTSYNSIKPTGGMSPLRNTRFCPKDSDNIHTIEI
jgi:hypothetical protein